MRPVATTSPGSFRRFPTQETNYEYVGMLSSHTRRPESSGRPPSARGLVLRLLELTEAAEHAVRTVPAWRTWERDRHVEAVEWGPRYRPSVWFGRTTDAERKRLRRCLARLQAFGLVELIGSPGGRRLSNVRFTAAGRAAAERSRRSRESPPPQAKAPSRCP